MEPALMAYYPLLKDYWPELVAELEEALRIEGEERLAATVGALRVNALCGCAQYDCQSFYTTPARGPWPDLGTYKSIPLDTSDAMVVLDVVDDTIMFVELLRQPPEPGYDRLASRVHGSGS